MAVAKVSAVITADIKDFQAKMTLVQQRLKQLSQNMQSVGNTFRQQSESVGNFGNKLEQTTSRVRNSTSAFSGLSGTLLGLGARFTALSAGLPVLASLTAGAIGLGAAFGAGTVAVAGFGAVAANVLKAVFDASEDIQKINEKIAKAQALGKQEQVNKLIKERAFVMSQLTEEQQRAATALADFKAFWDKFAKSFEKPVVAFFTESLIALQNVLQGLQPAFQVAVESLGDLFDVMMEMSNSTAAKEFFAWIAQQAGPMITAAGEMVINVFSGIVDLLMAFSPLASDIQNGLVGLTQSFADWASTLSQSNGFQVFMEYVKANAPVALSIIGNILSIVKDLVIALAPLGQVALRAIGGVAEALRNLIPRDIPLPDFSMITGWFEGLKIQIQNQDWNGIGAFIGLALKTGIDQITGLGQALIDKINTELQNMDVNAMISNIQGKMTDFLSGFASMFSQELGNAIKSGNSVAIGQAFGNMIMDGLKSLSNRVSEITGIISSVFNKIDWASVGEQAFVGAVGFILGFVNAVLDPAKWIEIISKNWDTILILILSIIFAPEKWIVKIGQLLAKIPFAGKFLQQAAIWFNQIGKGMRDRISTVFQGVWPAIVNAFKNAVKGDGIIATILRPFINLKSKVAEKLDELAIKANDKLLSWGKSMGTTMGNAWNWLKQKVVNGVNTVYSTLSGWYNKIVGWKNKLVSLFKSIVLKIPTPKLPKFSIEWRTYGKGPVSISIPIPHVYFATGGIVTGPTAAIIGEAGDEAVVPLSNKSRMKPFAEAVAKMMGTERQGETVINNYITINATIREEADIDKITEKIQQKQKLINRAGGIQFGY